MNRQSFSNTTVGRRTFLRAAGVTLSLPLLDALAPRVRGAENAAPRRMVFVCNCLGLHAEDFFPKTAGRDYELSPYLRELAEYRNDYTVFSGLAHPEVGNGHPTEASYLTSAPHANSASFRNTISLDQLAAEQVGSATRYPFLALSTDRASLSWTRNGVQIPADREPAQVFRRLFITGTAEEVKKQEQLLNEGHSILDSVRSETQAMERKLGAGDRERLDQYLTAVRAVENRLRNSEAWSKKPKPQVPIQSMGELPPANDVIGRVRQIYELTQLALSTDSTRLITLSVDQVGGVPPIAGVSEGYHPLSHHGMDPAKIAQLRLIEIEHVRALAQLLGSLRDTSEMGGTLLDHTMVMFGSNLGNASSHDPRNMPIVLAGGGFRHGQHLAFDRQNNLPLANLFVSMLQRFGVETDRFGTSTGTITGLEMA